MAIRKKTGILPDIDWFRNLSTENLMRAFTFYGTHDLSPGVIRRGEDAEKVARAYNTLKETPAPDSGLEHAVRKMLEETLSSLHPETLRQMRRELAASELAPMGEVKQLERLLVDELTVGGDTLDRAFFYQLSSGMSAEELASLRESVKERVEKFYLNVVKEHVALGGNFDGKEWRKTEIFIQKSLDSWFSPWTRLAGRMEEEIGLQVDLDEKRLSDILLSFIHLEEYKPYLDREFKGFVSNRCFDLGFDYSKMAPELRTPDLLKKWESDYPYLLESKEWDLLSMAYKAGSPGKMNLQEKPAESNGYIGGETCWSRYLNVVNGPTLPDGKVTGLGQIDYKDCTNAFVVLDGNARAMFFYGLPSEQKKAVLERVFDTVKYAEKNSLGRKKVTGLKF